MWEKLAKHAPPRVSVKPLQAAQSPKEKPDLKLQWDKPVWTNAEKTAGYILEARGRWSIERSAGIYTAWRRATVRNHVAVNLGCSKDRTNAEALCQADSQHD
jgi:hypothetical protein